MEFELSVFFNGKMVFAANGICGRMVFCDEWYLLMVGFFCNKGIQVVMPLHSVSCRLSPLGNNALPSPFEGKVAAEG